MRVPVTGKCPGTRCAKDLGRRLFMCLPIRRWRAVVVGAMFALAAHSAAPATAGVVAPPIASDSAPAENAVVPSQDAAERFNADYVPALAISSSNESQPFWFPGAD